MRRDFQSKVADGHAWDSIILCTAWGSAPFRLPHYLLHMLYGMYCQILFGIMWYVVSLHSLLLPLYEQERPCRFELACHCSWLVNAGVPPVYEQECACIMSLHCTSTHYGLITPPLTGTSNVLWNRSFSTQSSSCGALCHSFLQRSVASLCIAQGFAHCNSVSIVVTKFIRTIVLVLLKVVAAEEKLLSNWNRALLHCVALSEQS